MAANKPGKAEILAAFFDDGTYSPLFTDGAVSAAYGCANGQNAYVVFEDGSPVGVQDIEKNIRVLEMAAETGAPVVTFYDSTGAKLEGGLDLLNANARLTLHEGRNRQIRRMCSAVGLQVVRLRRSAEGPVKLGMLQPGEYRELKKSEINALRNAAMKSAGKGESRAASPARRPGPLKKRTNSD